MALERLRTSDRSAPTWRWRARARANRSRPLGRGRALVLVVALAILVEPPAASAQRIVSIFYYPWFTTPAWGGGYDHWAQDGAEPPEDIPTSYYPALGIYSMLDPSVLARQMGEIAGAGIDQIAVSWWGWGSPEDEALPTVIAAAHAQHIQVAVQIEDYSGRSVSTVLSDVAHLRTLGITTFYVYDPFDLAAVDWAPANRLFHAEGLRTFAETALPGLALAGDFSGLYTYDVLTWGAASFSRICAEAHAHHLLCAPSVGPGFDAVRATGNPEIKPRRNGLTYDTMWRDAIAADADEVTITSFNEWQEGTQIEPALTPAHFGTLNLGSLSYLTYNGAWGLTGVGAEDAYLDRTACWAEIYRSEPHRPLAAAAPSGSCLADIGWGAACVQGRATAPAQPVAAALSTQAAPTSSASPIAPATPVVPSADRATLTPSSTGALASAPLENLAPRCAQVEPVRANAQTAPASSPSVAPPTSARVPAADSATASPN